MRIGIATPTVVQAGTGADAFISVLTTEPWVANRPDGRTGERIATSWTWDEAGTTLRLKLRSDVYFHDGTQLTPAIAAESLNATKKAGRKETLSFSSVDTVVPIGPDTVDINLK